MTLVHMFLVGVGGFFGAIARFGINQIVSRIVSTHFPLATLMVNVLGSLFLGFLIGKRFDDILMLLMGVGFLGSFTTFSTFALESVQMFIRNKRHLAILYQVLSYGGGIIGAFLGLLLARII